MREEALALGGGMFFECLPDDPAPVHPRQASWPPTGPGCGSTSASARGRWLNNDYTRSLDGDDDAMPLLVLDPLDRPASPSRRFVRDVVRAILERKYAGVCPPEYVDAVVASFRDDPVRLREPRYTTAPGPLPTTTALLGERIALFVNDRHDIHHVHDRGYVEAPVRVRRILTELERVDIFERLQPPKRSLDLIREVHDPRLRDLPAPGLPGRSAPDESVYPYVFPIRNASRPPTDLGMRAGYYCIDTFTPLNRNAFLAARGAVDCALAGADAIRQGPAAGLRPGAAAGPPRRAPRVRRLLLLQQRRDGRA